MRRQSKGSMTRRHFLVTAGAGAGLALAACTSAPAASTPPASAPTQPAQSSSPQQTQSQAPAAKTTQTITWKMQSTWAAADFLQNNAKDLAAAVEAMSGGRLKIEVLPAGQVVPALEVLDAVHKGLLDAGHGSPAYWYGKHPATALFVGVPSGPFGMDYEDFLGWMYEGGGIQLYNELIQNELKLDVMTFPAVAVPPEPLGWFARPVQSVADFKGLKFRSAGMASETFKEVGMSVVTLPGGEVVPALERKVIDAAEWLTPVADMSLGFHDVAKYYHMPSVHQPLNCLEVLINKKKWEELPADLQAIVRHAISSNLLSFTFKLMKGNTEALETMINQHGVQLVEPPEEVQMEIIKAWDRVAARFSSENAFFKKVLDSQKAWASKVVPYRRVAYPRYELAADYYWANANPYKKGAG